MESLIDSFLLLSGGLATLGAGVFSLKTISRLHTAKKFFEFLKDAVEFWEDPRVQEAFKEHFQEDQKEYFDKLISK